MEDVIKGFIIRDIFNHFHNILIFCKIFFPPQMKRWLIIRYKHGIHDWPHELWNDLRLTTLRN